MKKLENYLERIDENIFIHGLDLKSFHCKHSKKVMPIIENKFHFSTYYYWIQGKSPIPISVLKIFSRVDKNVLDKAYKEMKAASVGNKKIFLPKKFDKKLAYLIGSIHGDGGMHKNQKYVTIANDSKEYLEDMISILFQDIFKVRTRVSKFKNIYRAEVGSRAVCSFLSLFCPFGKKTGLLHIPKEVKSDEKLKISYLSGLFDTDGCIGYGKNNTYFTFVQRDKIFVFEVYECLKSLGIHVNEPKIFYSPVKPYSEGRDLEEWRIYIGSKKDLYNLLSKISFYHPSKKTKAEKVKVIVGLVGFEPTTFSILSSARQGNVIASRPQAHKT